MKKIKIAMLIMVDGAVLDEKYFEYSNEDEEWNSIEESIDPALWFFY